MSAAVAGSERMQVLGWVKEQWQGTPSRLRLWMLGVYPQGQRWTCCRETSESPCPYACAQATVTSRKNLFPSRFRRRTRWLECTSLVHFPQSHVAFGRVYCSAYIFGSGSVRLTRRRGYHMPLLRELRPHVFIFWSKSPRQASKVAFSRLESCF